jgi:hypothetical protein
MPMKRLRALTTLISCIFLCLPALADGFKHFTVSADQSRLTITKADGSQSQVPLLQDQVGFDGVKISPDGHYIGWLALYPNLSYPVPMDLVVMDANGDLQKFGSDALIFEWCFLPDSKSVAFMDSSLHFTDGEEYQWRSLKDRKLLGRYMYPDDYRIKPELRANDERGKAIKNAPAWVKCVPKSPIDE